MRIMETTQAHKIIARHYMLELPSNEFPPSLRETLNSVYAKLGTSGDVIEETIIAWLLNDCQVMTIDEVIEVLGAKEGNS